MTEEEAKTKWCPMVKPFHVAKDEYVERTELLNATRNAAGNNCIGSACMMWRKTVVYENHAGGGSSAVVHYCGLAGKP